MTDERGIAGVSLGLEELSHGHTAARQEVTTAICLTGILSGPRCSHSACSSTTSSTAASEANSCCSPPAGSGGTNVIAFALWYWELDAGGPPRRPANPTAPRDFAFPQTANLRLAKPGW